MGSRNNATVLAFSASQADRSTPRFAGTIASEHLKVLRVTRLRVANPWVIRLTVQMDSIGADARQFLEDHPDQTWLLGSQTATLLGYERAGPRDGRDSAEVVLYTERITFGDVDWNEAKPPAPPLPPDEEENVRIWKILPRFDPATGMSMTRLREEEASIMGRKPVQLRGVEHQMRELYGSAVWAEYKEWHAKARAITPEARRQLESARDAVQQLRAEWYTDRQISLVVRPNATDLARHPSWMPSTALEVFNHLHPWARDAGLYNSHQITVVRPDDTTLRPPLHAAGRYWNLVARSSTIGPDDDDLPDAG